MNIKNVVKGEVVYSLRLKLGRYILNKQYPVKSRRRKLQQAFLQITLIDNFKRVLLTQLEYLRTKFLG